MKLKREVFEVEDVCSHAGPPPGFRITEQDDPILPPGALLLHIIGSALFYHH